MRPALVIAAAVVVVAAGACSESESGKQVTGTAASVACPGQASAAPLPKGWSVPLPKGAVPVDVRRSTNGRVIVTGVVPAPERDVLDELRTTFAKAGLTLTEGETEEHDAESNFDGNGLTGRWGIRELGGCGGPATRVDVVVRPD